MRETKNIMEYEIGELDKKSNFQNWPWWERKKPCVTSSFHQRRSKTFVSLTSISRSDLPETKKWNCTCTNYTLAPFFYLIQLLGWSENLQLYSGKTIFFWHIKRETSSLCHLWPCLLTFIADFSGFPLGDKIVIWRFLIVVRELKREVGL